MTAAMTPKPRKRTSPLALCLLHTALRDKPQSLTDLCSITELSKPVVTRHVNALCCEGRLHVGGWARDVRGYPTIKQFVWGDGEDVPCPRTDRTSAHRMATLRAARKAAQE